MNKKHLEELESLKELDKTTSKINYITYGMFGGLMITVVGVIMLLLAQKAAIKQEYFSIGFKIGIAGIAIYWLFRLFYLYKTKILKNKNSKEDEK